jgi:drug/metabolite transporter (DMT)-like permease
VHIDATWAGAEGAGRQDGPMSRRGVTLFLALSVIWGLPYFFIRVAVQHGVDPATLVFLRTAPAAAILLPFAWRAGALPAVLARWRWLVVYAFVHFGIPWLLMSSAEQHLSSSVTAMLVAAVPLLAAVVAHYTHPEDRFGPARLAGLGLGALGVGLLVGFDVAGSTWVWIAVMGVVVVGYTVGPVIVSLRLSGLQGIGVVACAVSVVALAYAPYGVTHLPTDLTWSTIGAIVVLALVCTAGAFLVFFELVHEIGPSRTVVVTYLNTGVAVALGVAVLGEPLTAGIVLGFPFIVAGSWLATRPAAAVSAATPPGDATRRRSWRRAPRSALPR